MRLDEAVRTFLTPTTFSVREDGVYLGARRFWCDELRATGVLDRSGKEDNGTKVDGYTLDMCIRHAWIEEKRKLLLVEAKLRIRGEEETLYMSLAELDQWSEARRKITSAAAVHVRAASTECMQRFESDTGRSWDGGKVKPGKPKQDAVALQEAKEARAITTGGKVT
jgi:hypothetical protein